MTAVRATCRPLGAILVERQLITAEQLDELLAEQSASHQRLGRIVVSRGLVSASELTTALREQLEEQIAVVSAHQQRHDVQGSDAFVGALLNRARRKARRRVSIADDVHELRSELHRTQLELAAHGTQIASLARRVAGSVEIGGESVAVTAPGTGAEDSATPAADEPVIAFLLFLPRGARGYELVRREGRPPTVGEILEVDGRRFTVSRVGKAPLPNVAVACAFLLADA